MRVAVYGAKGLPSRGGVERVAEAVVKRLATRHQITVYCDARYTPRGTSFPGVRLRRVPSLPGKHAQAASYFVLSGLHVALCGDYDLVHLHSVEAAFMLPLLRLRGAVVSTAHGSPRRSARSKWSPLAKQVMGLTEYPFMWLSSRITSVSDVDADYYEQRFGCRPVYVPNGVEEALFEIADRGEQVAAEYGLAAGGYVLFAAGRIDPTKGCHAALKAFLALDDSEVPPDLRFAVAGDLGHVPAYSEELRALADERVVFTGLIVEPARLYGLVRGCRVFIFPSLTEGMSMMLLEVAALGVPLICSDIEENTRVLGARALYFRSGDAADLRAKLAWALAHPGEMSERAAAARSWVRERYEWGAIARAYERLYEEVAG